MGATSRGNLFESIEERERKIYLENQARKVLERRGIAVGEEAGDEVGRRIGMEERVALEDIVQGLGGGGDRMEE
jgi:hypothetical protein